MLTVWYNVFERGRLTEGETVLIHGGSSGVGSVGVQMAKVMGATVLSTAGNAERCEAVQALGAQFVAITVKTISSHSLHQPGLKGKSRRDLGYRRGDLMQTNLDLAAPDGRIVSIGVMRGMQSEINLATLFMKRLTLTGSTLRRLEAPERARCFDAIRDRIWPSVCLALFDPSWIRHIR